MLKIDAMEPAANGNLGMPVTIALAATLAVLTAGCLGWDSCPKECPPGESYCDGETIVRCIAEDDIDNCYAWSGGHQCDYTEGGGCVGWSEDGHRRAACVDLSQPCAPATDWTCTATNTYHACFQGFVALDSFGYGHCEGDTPLCVNWVDNMGRGLVDCAISDVPCPGGRAQYCLGNAVHSCGEGGFPTQRSVCALDEHCVEGLDTEGNATAACALSDSPCPSGRDSVCIGDTVADCTAYGFPVAFRRCSDFDNFCVDFDLSRSACAPSGSWQPYGEHPIEYVAIAGGTIVLGLGTDPFVSIFPQVDVSDFQMLRTEVTVAQYTDCVAAGACFAPDTGSGCDYTPPQTCGLGFPPLDLCNWNMGRPNHPVNCVDFAQAQAFCSWAGGRLPSESEWEFAATSRGQLPETLPPVGCHSMIMEDEEVGCGLRQTWPVCSRPTGNTAQGLCDMLGNISEWMLDHYHHDYYHHPTDGTAYLGNDGAYRMQRGGAFDYEQIYISVSRRSIADATNRRYNLGFRCVR